MTRSCLIGLSLISSLVFPTCSSQKIVCVSEPVKNDLRNFFTYENRFIGARMEHFAVLRMGDTVFFQHNSPPEDYVAGIRPVYVLRDSKVIDILNCPDDAAWLSCASKWRPDTGLSADKNTTNEGAGARASCELKLEVPQWVSSPESDEKRQVASELLHEFTDHFATAMFKAVYVRDFNLKDRGIDFYYQLDSGEEAVQGCAFDYNQRPYCTEGWHMYGTVTFDSVKQTIMEMPYRLYPAPVGKP
jgi:hypothetical protein